MGTYDAVATFNSSDPNYNTWTDPAPGISTPITITIPDPTIPTNFVSTPASTTTTTLSWNAAWEPDANLTPASSYTITEKIVTPTGGGKGSHGSTTTYQTFASGITATSYTFSVPAGDRSFAVNSVDGNGLASPKTAYIYPQVAIPPSSTGYTLYTNGVYTPNTPSAEALATTQYRLNFVGTANTVLTFNVPGASGVVVTGGTFNFGPFDPTFGPSQHPSTAVAYATDGVTPLAGSISISYAAVPPAIPPYPSAPYNVGTYYATATFTSDDSRYGNATATTTIVINPIAATIVVNGGPFSYTGSTVPATTPTAPSTSTA